MHIKHIVAQSHTKYQQRLEIYLSTTNPKCRFLEKDTGYASYIKIKINRYFRLYLRSPNKNLVSAYSSVRQQFVSNVSTLTAFFHPIIVVVYSDTQYNVILSPSFNFIFFLFLNQFIHSISLRFQFSFSLYFIVHLVKHHIQCSKIVEEQVIKYSSFWFIFLFRYVLPHQFVVYLDTLEQHSRLS